MSDQVKPITVEQRTGQANVWRMYRAVVGVGIACALVIVVVYEVTRPIIERNRSELRRQAVMDVLPGAEISTAFRLNEDGRFEPASADDEVERVVFAGFDKNDVLVGLAIEAQGMGYQDTIRMLYGYSFDLEAIIGIRVLESRETPGLGDRVETDEQFLLNFEKLDVRLTEAGDELANPIEFVKPGAKSHAWQIDGISGATITSEATAKMLGDSAAWWIPRVQPHRSDFVRTGGEQQHGN